MNHYKNGLVSWMYMRGSEDSPDVMLTLQDHLFSKYAKFSE